MARPVVLFIPGSFTLLSAYEGFFETLSEAGATVQGVALPSVGPASQTGRDEPAPTMYDDAAVIAKAAEKLMDEGKEVIVMGHSYAGVPMSQATKGLSKQARVQHNRPGGIVRLAYIACLVPAVGQSAASLLTDVKPPPVSVDDNGWMLMNDPEDFARVVCNDLSAQEGKSVMEGLAKHSAQSFHDELTYAGYKDIPVSFLLCEQDQAGPLPFQRQIIAQMEEAADGRTVHVTSIDAGHMAILSKPKEVVNWIMDLVYDR